MTFPALFLVTQPTLCFQFVRSKPPSSHPYSLSKRCTVLGGIPQHGKHLIPGLAVCGTIITWINLMCGVVCVSMGRAKPNLCIQSPGKGWGPTEILFQGSRQAWESTVFCSGEIKYHHCNTLVAKARGVSHQLCCFRVPGSTLEAAPSCKQQHDPGPCTCSNLLLPFAVHWQHLCQLLLQSFCQTERLDPLRARAASRLLLSMAAATGELVCNSQVP